jgi:cytochrome c biogenesis protein CcdA
MISSFALAFVAGLVTILNPCVLPLIPILIGSALGQSRFGPLALAAGLVTSFTIFGFIVIAFGFSLGIDEQAIRWFAGGLLVFAGVVLLIPRLQAGLSAAASPLTNRGNQALSKVTARGVGGQYLIGLLLGLVWAPCVGPTLGVAIAAASTGENLVSAFFTFLIFGLGVAVSILLFAYGSRKALGDRRKMLSGLAKWGKPLFGIMLVVVGGLVMSGFDKMIEASLIEIMPLWLIEFTTRF